MPDGYFLNPRDYALFEKMRKLWPLVEQVVNQVRNISGTNGAFVSNTPAGIIISAPRAKDKPTQSSSGKFLFPVRLETDGGSAGTNGSASCNFTYKVLRYSANILDYSDDEVLDENVSLTGWGNGLRQLSLELTEATWGWAFYDNNGTLVLLFADERPAGEQLCS